MRSGELINQLAREGDALLLDRVITALKSLAVAPVGESEEGK